MRLTIVSVGHKMPEWVATATHDYVKRMPADCSIDIKEIKPDLTPAKYGYSISPLEARRD
jgi:23S rRNA (pseudouridine1915-N3)-methyltransferase